MERKTGDVFEFYQEKFIVVNSNGKCFECDMHGLCRSGGVEGVCAGVARTDKKSVMFKKYIAPLDSQKTYNIRLFYKYMVGWELWEAFKRNKRASDKVKTKLKLINKPEEWMLWAFEWSNTPEGFDLWKKMHGYWVKHLTHNR